MLWDVHGRSHHFYQVPHRTVLLDRVQSSFWNYQDGPRVTKEIELRLFETSWCIPELGANVTELRDADV